MSNIIWVIVIGFVAGIIARFLSAGDQDMLQLFDVELRPFRSNDSI